VTPARNKIYIFALDKGISADFVNNLKRYCEAFYLGLEVKIMWETDGKVMSTIPHRINDYTEEI